MRKIYVITLLALLCACNMFAATVKVTMNAVSTTMSLVDKTTGTTVETGEPASKVYTFEAPAGTYVLTAYATDGTTVNGTIELNVTGDAEQEFGVLTCTTYATNSGWAADNDYTVAVNVTNKYGDIRVQTVGNSSTVGRKTFLAFVGDSYNAELVPSEEHKAEGYMTLYKGGTLTANVNVNGAIPTGGEYTVTVPADADLYLGIKFAHFAPFKTVEAKSVETVGTNKVYTYQLANGQQYNFRTWKAGGLTQGGIFYYNIDEAKRPELVFTDADYAAKSPKFIDHDVKSNGGYNVADIFLNINPQNHLKMQVGDKYDVTAFRTWQAIESITNNYFLDPDYHYSVQSLTPGKTVGEIISMERTDTNVDQWTKFVAVGKGTVLVTVTYDAMALNQYANNSAVKTPFVGGEYWSAIWPENTGVFVVTVGEDAEGMTPNFFVNKGKNAVAEKMAGDDIDADFDVFYYKKGDAGYSYTFSPVGAADVKVAYPTIGENAATYSDFGSEGVTANADGSYTVLLKHGRQVIAVYDAEGKAQYQVATAKELEYEVANATRPGAETYMPGEQAVVKFNTVYHPANKLAGIHNFSAAIKYTELPEKVSADATANQYTFASTDNAQKMNVTIPSTWTADVPLTVAGGAVLVTGFGDPIGNHRNTSRVAGRNANFTAVQHSCLFGVLPEIEIPVDVRSIGLTFNGTEGMNVVLTTSDGSVISPKENGSYCINAYGRYNYVASAEGYGTVRSAVTISSDDAVVVDVQLPAIDETTWDGATTKEPAVVDGVYQVSNGYELAWIAETVNAGNGAVEAELLNDIELAGFAWTAIGNGSNKYTGTFDGKGHTVKNLYVEASTNYQGLFGYVDGGSVKNVSVTGLVNATAKAARVGGVVGYATGTVSIAGCMNYADVNAYQYVGGVAGYVQNAVSIDSCANFGNVRSSFLENVTAYGTSAGTSYAAGLVGYVATKTATVTNVLNQGNVAGANYTAGILNYAAAAADVMVANVYNTGRLSTTSLTNYSGAIRAIGATQDTGKNITGAFATAAYINETKTTLVTADQMASGEVAYKLGEAFGQEIGKDALPVLGGMVVLYDEATGVYYNEKEPEEKDYELRVLTFEDADYKAGVNFAGGNDWSSLIDDPQYGGALLYGESGMGVSEKADAYNWYDKDNTELSSILVNGWGSWCYWTGGHAVSNYGSSDIETYGGYNSQLTIYNKEAGEGIVRKGMGHNGSDNFAVHYGYHDNSGYSADEVPVLSFKDGVARVIDHMYVTNTCYALNCYMEGNGLTAKIGNDDWVKIVATGDNGKVAEFYLCNGPKNIVTDWTKWDLSELGEVTSVQFNVTGSSDNGYGFSQPAYFAYDDVAVRFPLAESVAVADFENSDEILVDATGVFHPEDEESETCYWNSGDYTFTTYTDDWGTKFYYDFVVTNSKSDKYETVADQYNSAAAGAKSGDNYAVWYNNFYGSEGIYMPEAMQLSGFYVTNTAWVVDALMNGDTMSVEDDGTKGMPFGYGGKKDKLTLVITGYNEEMEETGKVEYTLAENDDEKLYYVKDWRWVDLTELGTDVINVQFAIESTKQNDYGPTSPMYFCMDDFGGKAPATDAEMAVVDLSTLAIRNVNSTNVNVQRYDLMGRLAGKGKGIQIVRKGSKVRKTFNVR